MKINGETKLIGFFGSTFRTSKMYAMYNAVFEKMGMNFVYLPFEISDIKKGAEAVRALGIHAVGVTIPFKISIIPFLDELDEDAKRIGAVNVVINKNGKLIGGNTDGHGGVKALKEKTEIIRKKIILLGAGGAGRALAFAIKDEGGELTILNRTVDKAKNLAKAVGCQFGPLDGLKKLLPVSDILVNSTSVPNLDKTIIGKKLLPEELTTMDIVNNQRMLLWQGVLKFKIYTGIEPPVKVIEEALCQTH